MSKKTEFYQIALWRSCFQLGRNTYDICDKSGNAQFGKTQFFLDTLYIPIQCNGRESYLLIKGKVARGVFGDWRVAPFTSLKLSKMK